MEMKIQETEKVTKRSLNIKNLYLDPNNYRFIDEKDYVKIDDAMIISERVQKKTRAFIEGKKRANIQDLLMSIKANGFLKVDVIQLRDLGNNNYLVIEGNRRVTALKCLQEDYKEGKDIGKLDPSIFARIPAEVYEEQADSKEHLVIMGLKHISGNKKWPAINQAQLIYDYLADFQEDRVVYSEKELELCESLGITKNKLRTTQRAIYLINRYKMSDYGDQFETEMYSIFEEIVKKPQIRAWLEWDEATYRSTNLVNEERLFSWISKVEETSEDGLEEKEREPIITKASEIRTLTEFINRPEPIELMEKTGSVILAYQNSGIDGRTNIDTSIQKISDHIKAVKRYEDLLTDEDVEKLEDIDWQIKKIMPQRNEINIISKNVTSFWNEGVTEHFTEITIDQYKRFRNLTLTDLKRINIFAGRNNVGKTSVLEAIYLLGCQNNLSGFIELNQIRNKTERLSYTFVNSALEKSINISGEFNGHSVNVCIDKYNDVDIDKSDDYLTSFRAKGSIDENTIGMVLHAYEKGGNVTNYDYLQNLCKLSYSSPYYSRMSRLVELYNTAIETKYQGKAAKEYVLDFVRKVDSTIKDIVLVNDQDGGRFVVDSSKFPDKTVELSGYGDGIIRVFELALAFSACRNGILLIDEFETAIHYSMLIEFTLFVQEMAEKFNVQVFLTTHSKECVDAFMENGYQNEEISAYALRVKEGKNEVKFIPGLKLEKLINLISFDLRGEVGYET